MFGCFRRIEICLLCGLLLYWTPRAVAQIDLSLEPAEITVQPGETVELQLWARAQSALPVDGADVVIRWDRNLLSLQGNTDTAGSAHWSYSGFPEASPFNADLNDGEALYECLSYVTAPSPRTDLLLTTLQFVVLQSSGVVSVTLPVEGDTYVACGTEDALDEALGATVTVGSSSGGGTGGGGAGGDPGDDGTGGDNDGTTTQPGDDGTTTQPGGNGTEVPDNGSEPGVDEDSNGGGAAVRSPFCGAGLLESLMMVGAGLSFARVLPRRIRGH